MNRSAAMSSRERLYASLHQLPVDHVPFDPRIWYSRSGDKTFDHMDALEKAAYLECDHLVKIPYDQDQYHIRVRYTGVEIVEKKTPTERCIIYHTPEGELVRRERLNHGTWHPVEYPVKNVRDLKAMRHVYARSQYWVDPNTMAELEAVIEIYKETALPATGYVISPYMELVERLAGLENLVYLLYDHPQQVEELMALMHQDQMRKLKAFLPHTSIRYVFSMENTTVELVSPDLFRKYCLPQLTDYGDLIASFGKFHIMHMCGKIKKLLPDINQIPSVAVDTFSPPPTGDTTFADGVGACPGKALLGGTNMIWWLEPPEEVRDMILQNLASAGREFGLVLQGPWEFAPGITPEKIRDVWRLVRAELNNTQGG